MEYTCTNTDEKSYKIYTTLSLRKKRNYLHVIDMAKNKTVLQTFFKLTIMSPSSGISRILCRTIPL